jgi:hypothetical protein
MTSTGDGPALGSPRALFRARGSRRPPGPLFTGRAFRSPLRGPWLTSVFGAVLLTLLPIVIVTGLLSYIAYQPQFPDNAMPGSTHGLHLPFFTWPTRPVWLYRLNQGLHVSLGLALIPVVLAKLWSVIPKLFTWPPARSIAQVLERCSFWWAASSSNSRPGCSTFSTTTSSGSASTSGTTTARGSSSPPSPCTSG